MNTVSLGSDLYRPSKVVCVGRNYDAHVLEMGGKGRPAEPTIFIKPNSSIAYDPAEVMIPADLGLLHHEVELCCLIDDDGAIGGYAVGLDLTLRDLQSRAKEDGAPWTLAKGFDNAAVLGRFVQADRVPDPGALAIELAVNDEVRQRSNTREMIFSPREIHAFVERYMTMEEGDILMCGTPEGVGPLADGDRVIARIDELPPLDVTIRRP